MTTIQGWTTPPVIVGAITKWRWNGLDILVRAGYEPQTIGIVITLYLPVDGLVLTQQFVMKNPENPQAVDLMFNRSAMMLSVKKDSAEITTKFLEMI